MVKVYFEQPGYAEIVAYFADENIYGACCEALEKQAKAYNFEFITESVNEEFDFDRLDDFTNTDEKPKITYFIFGTEWVNDYQKHGIAELIKNHYEDGVLTGGASFEFINGETDIIEFAEAKDGWMDYATITKEEFDQLNK
jgi:hypothetical protein